MRTVRKYMKEMFISYCFAFGLLQTLYILQGFMPGYRGGQGYVSETAVYAAVLFSIIHFVITSE